MSRALKIIALVVSFLLIGAAHPALGQSADPNVLITWRANDSYIPPGYPDKALPNQSSPITASIEVISSSGQIVDLSGQNIYWYIGQTLLGGGVGQQDITFYPFDGSSGDIVLEVDLPDYPSGSMIQTVDIPLVQPKAVIQSPPPGNQLITSQVNLLAAPYFFNATSTMPFTFDWSVNGTPVTNTQNPESLQVSLGPNTPSNYAVNVTLSIGNISDGTQASASTDLIYQPQP